MPKHKKQQKYSQEFNIHMRAKTYAEENNVIKNL